MASSMKPKVSKTHVCEFVFNLITQNCYVRLIIKFQIISKTAQLYFGEFYVNKNVNTIKNLILIAIREI